VITVNDGGTEKTFARAVKPSSQLTDRRVVEKLEIEGNFWASQGVDWGLVTEKEIDPTIVANIKWLHPYRSLREASSLSPAAVSKAEALLFDFVSENRSMGDAGLACDDRLGLPGGSSVALVRHFLATRRWRVDMCKLIDLSQRLVVTGRVSAEEYEALHQHAA